MTDEKRLRLRSLDITIGHFEPGPENAITDVAGVIVGHVTCMDGAQTRTGATAILPHAGNLFQDKVPAGFAVLNGFGKFAGSTQIVELGEIETPIVLTNTLAVGRAIEAINQYTLAQHGNEQVVSLNAVVGETNDSVLNDIRAPRPKLDEILSAISAAKSGAVDEGAVGAGTGTVAFGLKGGIGTSSRLVRIDRETYTVGVLVQSNYGGRLTVAGRAYEAELQHDKDGSIVIVLATDAPLCSRNLQRLAERCFGGLARTGAALSNGSGDYRLGIFDCRLRASHPGTAEGDRGDCDTVERCRVTVVRGRHRNHGRSDHQFADHGNDDQRFQCPDGQGLDRPGHLSSRSQ